MEKDWQNEHQEDPGEVHSPSSLLGLPRESKAATGFTPDEQASAEIQQRKAGRWLSKLRKGKERELEVKTPPRWKERHCKGLVQKPRGAPATPGVAQPALMVTSPLFGGSSWKDHLESNFLYALLASFLQEKEIMGEKEIDFREK